MLALIGGTGRLPAHLIARCDAEARPLALYELDGFPLEGTGGHDVTRFHLETLGSVLMDMHKRGVTGICLAGAIRRPAIDPERIDAATAPLVPKLHAALVAGDDAALRMILGVFEDAGFTVHSADEIAPDLLPPAGVLSRRNPTESDHADAARGDGILAALAAADIGQACAVAAGQALAVETLAGTDAMLRGLEHRPEGFPAGGLLLKAPKPGQDRRADMPTIGPQTVLRAAAAGLHGIAIEAGGVLVLDRHEVVRLVDAFGLLLWLRNPG